jgi:hypothetical protein
MMPFSPFFTNSGRAGKFTAHTGTAEPNISSTYNTTPYKSEQQMTTLTIISYYHLLLPSLTVISYYHISYYHIMHSPSSVNPTHSMRCADIFPCQRRPPSLGSPQLQAKLTREPHTSTFTQNKYM